MNFIKVNGIVVKEVNTGEADKYISLFTDKLGKVTVYAKAVRKTKSRTLVGTQFLNYCEYVLYLKKDKYYISSCELIESFYGVRNDIVLLTYATHFSDIILSVIQEEQCVVLLLRLFLNSLYILSKNKKDPKLINIIFEFRMLYILGYSPYVKGCSVCGETEDRMFFSFTKSGLVCEKCVESFEFKYEITRGSVNALQFINMAPLQDLFKFELSNECIDELTKIAKIYLKDKLEREYTKLDFLDKIKLK